jgi:uracil-DNA glycosylase family 4
VGGLDDLANAGDATFVYGVGNPDADLVFIGESPGRNEDEQGEPFVGLAGQLLNTMLCGIDIARKDVYITNVVKHRPPENRDPLPDELEACAPWLAEEVELVDPTLIVTLGKIATCTILGREVEIGRVRGQRFVWGGRTVIPTYHPSYVRRTGFGSRRRCRSSGRTSWQSKWRCALRLATLIFSTLRPPERRSR